MTVQAWTFVLVGLSFALYIGVAVWSRAHSTSEFYVAGTDVSPLANGMATAADWMSAASFISMAGIISFSGYDGVGVPHGVDGRVTYSWRFFSPPTSGSSVPTRCPTS